MYRLPEWCVVQEGASNAARGEIRSRRTGKAVEYAATCAATEWRVAHFVQKDPRMWHGSPTLLRVFFSRCKHKQETPGRSVVQPGVSSFIVTRCHIRGAFCAFSGFGASWSLCASRNSYAFQDAPRALRVARLAHDATPAPCATQARLARYAALASFITRRSPRAAWPARSRVCP